MITTQTALILYLTNNFHSLIVKLVNLKQSKRLDFILKKGKTIEKHIHLDVFFIVKRFMMDKAREIMIRKSFFEA